MYTHCGAPSKAIQLRRDHSTTTTTPDKFTWACVLSACAATGNAEGLQAGREVH